MAWELFYNPPTSLSPVRVKMRKSHSEHFSTPVPQKADVVLNAANGSFVPQAVIAQMRCPSLRFEPRAKKSCRPLLEQFRPRVRNEAIAVRHLHARKRLRVENHCFVDNIAFRKDESYHRINLIGI